MGTTVTNSTTVTSITGYKVYGALRLGSNGDPFGDWEYALGTATTGPVANHIVWDADPQSTIQNATPVAVTLTVPGLGASASSLAASAGVSSPLTIASGGFSTITSVKVRALVIDTDCQYTWGSVAVAFTKNGTTQETLNSDCWVTSRPDDGTQEQIVTFTPTASDNTGVIVTGSVTIYYPYEDIDGPDVVAGQIYVFTS